MRRAIACTAAAAAIASVVPLSASAQDDEPQPSLGIVSDCCEAPPFCLGFHSAPRLAVRPHRPLRVGLDFELSRRPRAVTAVRIDGRPARVMRRHGYNGRAYRAVVPRMRMRAERRYAIRIEAEMPPSPDVCLLGVPRGVDHTPPDEGGTCGAGCFDVFLGRERLRRSTSP